MADKVKEPVKEPTMEFESRKEAEQAAAEFRQLLNQPAWQRLEKYLDRKLGFFASQLRYEKLDNMDALLRLRDKMNLTEQFRNLPEILATFVESSVGEHIEFDPFLRADEFGIDKPKQ